MNLKEHLKADLLLLGYTDESIHRIIDDLDSLKYKGPQHRMFGHNWATLNLIKSIGGKEAFNIALLHILIDFDIIIERKNLKKYITIINITKKDGYEV